jgi:arginyl-tRNA synthetase
VITGDLDRLLEPEIGSLAAQTGHGTTPPAGITSAGTWDAAPAEGAPGPGTYATPVALRLADGHAATAARIATGLAAALRRADWVSSATVMDGYVTVTVTADALAALAVRITRAGPACARSTALAGTTIAPPRDPQLASAPDWAQARRHLSGFISGRLAEAAGARIARGPGDRALDQRAAIQAIPGKAEEGASLDWLATDENAARGSLGAASPAVLSPGSLRSDHAERLSPPAPHPVPAPGAVADAIAFAGSWAISYALARLPPGTAAPPDPGAAAAHHLGNPAYAVRYAHAHAASTLRQAADLGLRLGEAAESGPRLLTHPSEQWLLDELSWLPERVAGAARRARPDVFTRYLERLAGRYFDCQEASPAMGPGTAAGGPETVARLWLAAASGTALRAGLDLLGVDAPDRL